ncbi:MAG: alkane 1-monooxygenase [Cytophagales bacterium]|nr:alkane 1-monooxygenase [Bernardetiaceae bacterium]MDW8204606.1 alkane 1-monooxygenase [Cytophagales bacterium]
MKTAKKVGFFSAFIIPTLVIAGFYAGGWWNYAAAIFVFVLIPLIDLQVGLDDENVPDSQVKIVSEAFYYRFITYLWSYFQIAFVLWALWQIAVYPFTAAELIGFTIGVPLVTGGIGITVAHELGHKKSAIERLYAQVLLMTVCYMHFYIEHNKGHHVYVGTPLDPATSRRGENFYAFWWRSVSRGYLHAWQLEIERLRKKGISPYSLQNMMLWYAILPIIFVCLVAAIYSAILHQHVWLPVIGFFMVQSVLAFTLLELVNYIEHYGIERRQIAPGRYEKVNTLHSWNANQLISNFFLFQLQRHSDHHAYAHKRYQVLRHIPESPQLPAGYPAMILLALVPPLWFAVMDKKLDQWQQAQKQALGM